MAPLHLSLPEYAGKTAYFGGIKNARFKSKVTPGDVVVLECTLTKRRGPCGRGRGQGHRGRQGGRHSGADLCYWRVTAAFFPVYVGTARQKYPGKRDATMLKNAFFNVYTKFKLHFYQEIFQRFQSREASLTTVETFCMEAIQALGSPTVNEFATFMRISPPNAAYKVNSLVKKGYLRKVQSSSDKREYHLEVTQKYVDYYNISVSYMVEVMDRIAARFSKEDCAKLEEMLTIVSRELMPEVDIHEASMPE